MAFKDLELGAFLTLIRQYSTDCRCPDLHQLMASSKSQVFANGMANMSSFRCSGSRPSDSRDQLNLQRLSGFVDYCKELFHW